MFLALDSDGYLQQQIYRALRAEILAGHFAPSARLPSTRTLAASLKVSRNTAVLAYEQLFAEGYAQARMGSRAMVAPALPQQSGVTAASLSSTGGSRAAKP